jgi:hypothetical protein
MWNDGWVTGQWVEALERALEDAGRAALVFTVPIATGLLISTRLGASSASVDLVMSSTCSPFFISLLKTRNTKMMTEAAITALAAMNAGLIVALCAVGRRPGGGASHAVGSGDAVKEEAAMMNVVVY